MSLRFLTAGESHGPALTVVVEGLPANVPVPREVIDRDLRRRMGGYGRGGRMKIEKDRVEFLGGVRFGKTLGSPVSMLIRNLDFENWTEVMSPEGDRPADEKARALTRPRPGHADLAGALKYGTHDARDILERASARETTSRTAAGALARCLLRELGIEVTSRTVSVGDAVDADFDEADFDRLLELPDDAPMRCLEEAKVQAMIDAVESARKNKDSIGGVFEVLARGVPPGFGSHVHWDRKIDGRLAGAVMSIQAVKAVSVGEGIEGASRLGSEHHDPILYNAENGFHRPSNRAGGVEGGITNGEIVRVAGYLKPLATLPRPLPSVDLVDKTAFAAQRERTDTIPIVAAGVVGEAMVCLVLAQEALAKFGGDNLDETRRNLKTFEAALAEF
ncbi:MAG: chorismate synthase [Acidobacteriota bacterium]|nr:chorismate synthase [Acidobacteriota bacterium]